MEIDYLSEFVSLVLHRNYTLAARELHVSQPSLSRHMAALEKDLRAKLFFDTHPLDLTAAGEIAFKRANDIITTYQKMRAELDVLPRQVSERILIQDLLHLESLYTGISKAIELTKQKYPHVHFEYISDVNDQIQEDALKRHSVDVAFKFEINSEPFKKPTPVKGYKTMAVPDFHGELGFGLKKGSALLQNKNIVLRDLEKLKFLLPAKHYIINFKDDLIKVCREAGFFPNIELIPFRNNLDFYSRDPGENIFVITKMVDYGRTAFDEKIRESLTVISPRDKTYYIDATMLVREDDTREAFVYFIDTIEEIENERKSEQAIG